MRRYVLGSAQSEDMFIIGMGFWAKYFIRTALLVIIHIICTQKWARGFKEPSRYDAYINIYNNKKEPASMTCTHKPGQNNRVYYTACNLYSTGDRPCNFVFILLLLYQSIYSLIALSNSSIVLYSSQ